MSNHLKGILPLYIDRRIHVKNKMTNKKKYEEFEETKSNDAQYSKVTRRDVDIPEAELADLKLAEKLDSVLKLKETSKPKFVPNKLNNKPPFSYGKEHQTTVLKKEEKATPDKNESVDERLRRFCKRYETLAPELDPKRDTVRVVKVLSNAESISMARVQAKKEYERDLYLNSVMGNLRASQT